MSKIAQHLRMLASAARVSMESDTTAPTADGEITDQELEQVAAQAEESVDAAGSGDETFVADDTTNVTTEVAADDTQTDAPADAASPVDAPADAALATPPPTEDTPPVTEEVPAEEEEIQTPAEQDLQAQLQSEAEEQANAEAAAVQAEVEGEGDATTSADSEAEATPVETAETTEVAAADDLPAPGEEPAQNDLSAEAPALPTDEVPAVDDVPAPDDNLPAVDDTVVSEDVSAIEPVVEETAVETTEEPTGAESPATAPAAVEEERPASPPGPQSDTSEAVQEVVELTEALASAQSAEEVVKKAREVTEGLEDAVGVAEHLNEQGGVSVEAFSLLQLSLRPHLNALGRNFVQTNVSFESYSEDPKARLQISLEEIKELIEEMELAQPVLERQAVESLDRTVCALKDAIPSTCARLKAVMSQATLAGASGVEGLEVNVSDGLANALSFNGQMPEDLANELQLYAMMGRALLGEYAEKAFAGARASSLLNNAIVFDSTTAFWEKVGVAVDNVCDPRAVLGEANLMMGLPGGGHLCGDLGPDTQTSNEVLTKVVSFVNNRAPLETALVSTNEGAANTYPALSPAKILMVGHTLQEVLDCDHICARLDEGKKLWPEAADAVRFLQETLSNAPDTLDYNSAQHFPLLVKFVETSYSLATWPLINYLANLVLTVNAFVLFAERSLTAKPAEATPVTEDVAVEEVVPVAETGDNL